MKSQNSCSFSCRFRLKSGRPYRRRVSCRISDSGLSIRQNGVLVFRVVRDDVSEFGYSGRSFYVRAGALEYRFWGVLPWKIRQVCHILDAGYDTGGDAPDDREFGR